MKKRKNLPALAAIAAAALLILAGIADGQPAAVMAKAVRICLECVGIG